MNMDIFKEEDKSGRMSKESYLIKNHKEEYDFIIVYCEERKIECAFKEKVYIAFNGLKSIPKCANENCENNVKYKNFTLGYLKYCSKKCISSDPEIKKIKEYKSMMRFGTKTPAQSKEVKEKIIKTNKEKWGGNSPMSNISVKRKSEKTLMDNWGVENPAHSKEILERRIKSFKRSGYKENFKKKMLEKYGVDHPWKMKDVREKISVSFYSSYRERIDAKVSETDVKFIKFSKEGPYTDLEFICTKCEKDFKIKNYQFYFRSNNGLPICTKCHPISESSSISQTEMFNFISECYKGQITQNDKTAIPPYEIDIYLPDLKLGFEFNGVFWHSSKFKKKDYHLKKYEMCQKNGIRIVNMWEDDWVTKREICESFLANKIRPSESIMARKTKLSEVSYLESKSFLESNHLQGDCKSSVRVGLYLGEELVSLMTFSKLRLPLGGKNKEGNYELTRFCNKLEKNVVGGASKMLKYFLKNYNPYEIQTYSDNMISDGGVYEKMGFQNTTISKPGYYYVINGIREHRFNWRKQKLIKMGYDKSKTEEEIMAEIGHWRIYNAGNKKWILRNKKTT